MYAAPLRYTAHFVQNPMILDVDSDGEKVLSYVGDLMGRLDALQEKAFTYKSYQKAFKVNTLSV